MVGFKFDGAVNASKFIGMTDAQAKFLEDHLLQVHKENAAILAQQGLILADFRAFRDAMFAAFDKQGISGDDLFDEYRKRFDEYCATIQLDPERVLARVAAASLEKH